MLQQQLQFFGIDIVKLKKGKTKCPCCSRPMKAYGYNLDDKLVKMAYQILEHCSGVKRAGFNPKEVFGQELRANTQFQKLKCFEIIKRTKHTSWWKLTRIGYSFLKGNITLPKKVWVFADEVVHKSEDYIHVGQVEPRWKEYSSDWTLDYILHPYKSEVSLQSLFV